MKAGKAGTGERSPCTSQHFRVSRAIIPKNGMVSKKGHHFILG